MNYDLDIKIEENYFYATATGSRTLKSIERIVGEIIETCKKHNLDRVVVDIRQLMGQIPIFDSLSVIFDEFPYIWEEEIVTKAALVDSRMRKVRYSFFERVARKKGYDIRFFSDPEKAIKWIIKD
jgi:hypothetical protein